MLKHSCLCAALMLALAGPPPVLAQSDARYAVALQAQDLGAALKLLTRQTKLQIVYSAELVEGKQVSALNGSLTATEALTRLLEGSGLKYEFLDSQTVTLSPIDPPSPPVRSRQEAVNPAGSARSNPKIQQIDAVIVTAQKRTERLEDVPLPVQVLGQERLYKLGAKNLGDYAGTVAGLTVSGGGAGSSQVFMRGISAPQGYMGMESAIGVYLDEVPISEGIAQPDMNLYDINRIEVLRGPQGTLYGSASLGGTIRMITNRPDPGGFSGLASTELSSTRKGGFNTSYHGVINVPIVADRLAVRAVAYGRNVEGFIDDPVLGASNVNDEETYGVRASVRYQPSQYWTFDLSGSYQDVALGGPSTVEDVDGSFRQLEQYRNFSTPSEDRNNIYNFTAAFENDSVSFTSSTSFSERERTLKTDITGFNFIGNHALTPSVQGYATESFTQEMRLSSVRAAPFTWLVGGYYNRKETDFSQDIDSVGAGEAFGLPSDQIAMLRESNAVRQAAVFGEVGFSPNESLTLTAGLRISRIETSASTARTGLLAGGDGLFNQNEDDDSVFIPKLNVSYKMSRDSLVYAQAAKGYRVGGQNVSYVPLGDGFEFPASYGPDSLWNYELGFKGMFLDRRLNFNVAAFYIDWKDIQLSLLHRGYDYFANAGNATSKGLEFEGTLLVTENVQVGAQITYTDSVLSTTTPGVGNKGERVPDVPRLSTSGFVEVGRDTGAGQHLYARLDLQQTGQRYAGFGSGARPYGNFSTVNARVGLDSYDWRFALFVRNVFDRRGKLGAGFYQADAVQIPGIQTVIVNRPRTIGVEVIRTF